MAGIEYEVACDVEYNAKVIKGLIASIDAAAPAPGYALKNPVVLAAMIQYVAAKSLEHRFGPYLHEIAEALGGFGMPHPSETGMDGMVDIASAIRTLASVIETK